MQTVISQTEKDKYSKILIICEILKKVELIETEYNGSFQGLRVGWVNGKILVKVYKLPVLRSRALVYRMETIINNTVLYT